VFSWIACLATEHDAECAAADGHACADGVLASPNDYVALEKTLTQVTEGNPIIGQVFGATLDEAASDLEIFKLKVACKNIMVTLLDTGEPEYQTMQQSLAKYCAYHAGGRGVFSHHQQWGSIYNPELRGVPVYPRPLEFWPELETAISALELNLPALVGEYSAGVHKWKPVAEQYLKIKGSWNDLSIIDGKRCKRKRFPKSCKRLADFAKLLPRCRGGCLNLPAPYFEAYEVVDASFIRLEPGSQITWHTSSDNQKIKLHCGLSNPSRVSLHVANSTMVWQEGACFLWDDSFEHAVVIKESDKPRVILEVVITHPDFENSSRFLDVTEWRRTSTYENLKAPRAVVVKRR